MARAAREVFTPGVIIALAALVVLAGVGHALGGTSAEELRQFFAVPLLFFVVAAWSLFHLLKGSAVTPRARYPKAEAIVMVAASAVLLTVLTLGADDFPSFNVPFLGRIVLTQLALVVYAVLLLSLVVFRPRLHDLGLTRFPQITNWLVVLVVGILGYVARVRLDFTNLDAHVAQLPATLLYVAIPANLFFRALFQTRAELILPAGWAILAQGIFSAALLGASIVAGGREWTMALQLIFPALSLSMLTGIVWYRTRSLYLCVLLHLFISIGFLV
ncbi:MAG TPA: CPBP family glutamic-type intramembrane protease [Candidatus Thermoplasmatota archaeon]|nr:CPBP family glutamic-type intramembrane protease [Candidatus Thermoplasmatota archaeon]